MTEPRQVVARFKEEPAPKKKPRRKKGVKTLLMEDCDAMFGAIIRSAGRCFLCGKTENLQCAHGFSRRYRATRWDERNAFCACYGCHLKYTLRPLEWDEILRDQWGIDLYDKLRDGALHGSNPDMKALSLVLADRCEVLGLDVKRRAA